MNNTIDQFVERFHEHAAKGNVEMVKGITEGTSNAFALKCLDYIEIVYRNHNRLLSNINFINYNHCRSW